MWEDVIESIEKRIRRNRLSEKIIWGILLINLVLLIIPGVAWASVAGAAIAVVSLVVNRKDRLLLAQSRNKTLLALGKGLDSDILILERNLDLGSGKVWRP